MRAWKGEELAKKGHRTLFTCLYFPTIPPPSFIVLHMFLFNVVCGAWMFSFLWIAGVIKRWDIESFLTYIICQQFGLKPVKLEGDLNTLGTFSFLIFTNVFLTLFCRDFIHAFHCLVQLSVINASFPLQYSKGQELWNVIKPNSDIKCLHYHKTALYFPFINSWIPQDANQRKSDSIASNLDDSDSGL